MNLFADQVAGLPKRQADAADKLGVTVFADTMRKLAAMKDRAR